MKSVVVFKTFNQDDAQLVRSRLEAANFHPFIANENVASWLAGMSNATTLRIEVPENEAEDVRQFLAAPQE
jgi:Putative prokaryotic signal transducing protein